MAHSVRRVTFADESAFDVCEIESVGKGKRVAPKSHYRRPYTPPTSEPEILDADDAGEWITVTPEHDPDSIGVVDFLWRVACSIWREGTDPF